MLNGKQGTAMLYTIEFFRYGKTPIDAVSVARGDTDEFDNLDAATAYGRMNVGPTGNPDEFDGFQVRQTGTPRIEITIRTHRNA
jgi:hypothetical protein